MLMTYIYQFILFLAVVFIIMELFSNDKFSAQATAALALIPFIIRLFMIG